MMVYHYNILSTTMEARLKQEMNENSKKIYEGFSQEVKDFYNFHGVQLFGFQFPLNLVPLLRDKLINAIYDVGEYFQIIDNEENDTFSLRAKQNLEPFSQVFIIEHALTFRYPDLRRVLHENPSLIPRIQEMLKYCKNNKKLSQNQENKAIGVAGNFAEIQFDSMDLTELSHLQLPINTVVLSLINNHLTDDEELVKKMKILDLRVLWVNGNPIENSELLQSFVKESKIQIFNSKFTKNCTEWGLKYSQKRSLSDAYSLNVKQISSLDLDDRNIYEIDVSILNKFTSLTFLSIKGHSMNSEQQRKIILSILDSNKNLKFLYVDFDVEAALHEMLAEKCLEKEIAERVLINGHSLLLKEATLEDLEIDEIQRNIFKLAGCYRLASPEKLDESSVWYLNDEVGSAIQHSDEPNFKMVPFLFSEDNKVGENMWAYSLLMPTKPINAGDMIYRDFLHNIPEAKQRSSRLAIWYDIPMQKINEKYEAFRKEQIELEKASIQTLTKFYEDNTEEQKILFKKKSENNELYIEKFRLVCDYEVLLKNTTHQRIELVKDVEECDGIWMVSALEEEKWGEIKDKYYINQFPFEACVVMKQNLANTIQSVFGETPYLMRTFDLEKQLAEFIGEYKARQKKGEDNLWILKPPNMARSMDMIITDNLSLIVKSMETGPKIAQKYILKPVLRQGKKVDLRYILLVKSIKPLSLYLYKHFWIRSSNNPYTVDRRTLSTYQTQFTVMNYGEVSDFKQIKYKHFIEEFEKDYSPVKWDQINDKIKKMLRNTFVAAGIKFPEMHSEKSRAVYGIDIMIDEESMEPKLLEITFSPDCKRACDYYPNFYNQVLETLFLETVGENMERII